MFKRGLVALLLFLIIISQVATAEVDFITHSYSELGPIPGLLQDFSSHLELPSGPEAIAIHQVQAQITVYSMKQWEVFLASREYYQAQTTRQTVDYLRHHLADSDQEYPEGEFFLKTQILKTRGAGLTWKTGGENWGLELSALLLPDVFREQRHLVGNISGKGAWGSYEFIQEDPLQQGYGFSGDLSLQTELGLQTLTLQIRNIYSYLYWPATRYELGQFNYRHYRETEDGLNILPPLLRGTRHSLARTARLPWQGQLILDRDFSGRTGRISLFFPEPSYLKLTWPLGEKNSLLIILPRPAAGVKYDGNTISFQLWADDFRLHKIQNIGLAVNLGWEF